MKAIIIGASSRIGRELAQILVKEGYEVGIVARRKELLFSLQNELLGKTYIKQIDISASEAISQVESLIDQMKGIDLAIISAGTGFINPELYWQKEKDTVDVYVLDFTAMANVFMKHFLTKGKGHFVGISSIVAIKGEK